MAHVADSTVLESVLQVLSQEGFAGLAEAIRILINEAMKIERSTANARSMVMSPEMVVARILDRRARKKLQFVPRAAPPQASAAR